MSLSELSHFALRNYNSNNILKFNNISMELYVFTAGLISNLLFGGAMFFLHHYCCLITDPNDIRAAYDNLRYLRSYVAVFRRFMTKIRTRIDVDFNIDLTDNGYLNGMMHNLSKIIRLTSISNYVASDEFGRFMKMKDAVRAEYDMLDVNEYSVVIAPVEWVKRYYIQRSIVLIEQFHTLLYPPIFTKIRTPVDDVIISTLGQAKTV